MLVPPSAEEILSWLVELYAKQVGVKVEYTIEIGENNERKNNSNTP